MTGQDNKHLEDLPIVTIELNSPTSMRMKNSYITRHIKLNYESSFKNLKYPNTPTLSNGGPTMSALNFVDEEKSKIFIERSRPSARDGHTANLIETADSSQILVVFGGDRNNVPFNDLYLLNFTAEISRNSELLTRI